MMIPWQSLYHKRRAAVKRRGLIKGVKFESLQTYLECASGSRLRETAAYAHIFMNFHGLLMHERSERTGHKNE